MYSKVTSNMRLHITHISGVSLVAKWWRIWLQWRRCRRHGFDPWVQKISWRRRWQPTPAFFPGKSHRQRSLVGYSPWTRKNRTQLSVQAHNINYKCILGAERNRERIWTNSWRFLPAIPISEFMAWSRKKTGGLTLIFLHKISVPR